MLSCGVLALYQVKITTLISSLFFFNSLSYPLPSFVLLFSIPLHTVPPAPCCLSSHPHQDFQSSFVSSFFLIYTLPLLLLVWSSINVTILLPLPLPRLFLSPCNSAISSNRFCYSPIPPVPRIGQSCHCFLLLF